MSKLWKFLFFLTWVVIIGMMVFFAIYLSNAGDRTNQNIINQYLTKGEGPSAYQVALKNGFVGTEAEWLASLQGKDSVSTHTVKEVQTEVHTVEQVAIPGLNGQSAYQLWLSLGNLGTEADFLASLKGKDGKPTVQQIRFNADLNVFQTKLPNDFFWVTVPICGGTSGKVCS